jgi:hypothetical protein
LRSSLSRSIHSSSRSSWLHNSVTFNNNVILEISCFPTLPEWGLSSLSSFRSFILFSLVRSGISSRFSIDSLCRSFSPFILSSFTLSFVSLPK